MSLRSFIIHLDRAEKRKAQVAKLLQNLPNAEVLAAVDGSFLSDAELADFNPDRTQITPRYPFALSDGEIGCFASHRRAWQKILDDDMPMALIVEDDVDVDPVVFDKAISVAQDHIGSKGYVQFQVRKIRSQTHLVATGAAQLLRPVVVPLRTSAQLVSKDAARLLLEASVRIDRPVDTWLQMYWETGVDVFFAAPSGVSDLTDETGGSTISRKRSFPQKIAAQVKRGFYRRKIASLSQENWPY